MLRDLISLNSLSVYKRAIDVFLVYGAYNTVVIYVRI